MYRDSKSSKNATMAYSFLAAHMGIRLVKVYILEDRDCMDGIRPHKLGVGLSIMDGMTVTWKSNDTRYFSNAMHSIVSPKLTCDDLSDLASRFPQVLT
jgi:hypothetical protein